MKWHPAVIEGVAYDLSHLHPFRFTLALEARGALPGVTFEIDVLFSMHCFTEELKPEHPVTYHYSDARETRAFSFERYELSARLPELVKDLPHRRCYEALHNNYMTIDLIRNGREVQYQVYFKVSRVNVTAGRLCLFVQSAYTKDDPKKTQRAKPCQFKTICVQMVLEKEIAPPGRGYL